MTVIEWLNNNTEFEEAIFINTNGEEESFWYDNDNKYNATVLRVEAVNEWQVRLYTDYIKRGF